jgi:hypothetical protein
MVGRRAMAFALRDEWTLFLWCDRSLYDLMERYVDPLMADSHAPVDHLLNRDPLRTDAVLYLIERPVILDRMAPTGTRPSDIHISR